MPTSTMHLVHLAHPAYIPFSPHPTPSHRPPPHPARTAAGGSIRLAELLPDKTPEARRAMAEGVQKWVKGLPLASRPLVKTSVQVLMEEGVLALQRSMPTLVRARPLRPSPVRCWGPKLKACVWRALPPALCCGVLSRPILAHVCALAAGAGARGGPLAMPRCLLVTKPSCTTSLATHWCCPTAPPRPRPSTSITCPGRCCRLARAPQKPAAPVEYEAVPPSLLLAPFTPGPNQVKSHVQGGCFELGDRVVSLLRAGVPPFGLHGTVIGGCGCWGALMGEEGQ